jgi:hypothetical protein
MKKFALSLCTLGMLAIASVGCGSPDPAKNPDFKQDTLMDPGAVKMGADAPKPNLPTN